MARFNVAEYAVLGSLHRGDPRNFLQALQAIPRTLRTMYLHAWQVPLSLPLHFFFCLSVHAAAASLRLDTRDLR